MNTRFLLPSLVLAVLLSSLSAASAANGSVGSTRYDTVGIAISGEWRDFGDFGDSPGAFGIRGIWQPIPWLATDLRFTYFERAKGDKGLWDGIRTRVVPLEAALAGVLPLGKHAALYGGPGIGWYSIQARSPKRKVVTGYDEEGHASYEVVGGVTKNTDELGYFVFAGGRVEFTESLWLFAEIRHTFLTVDCTVEGMETKIKADADGFGVTAGLVFGL